MKNNFPKFTVEIIKLLNSFLMEYVTEYTTSRNAMYIAEEESGNTPHVVDMRFTPVILFSYNLHHMMPKMPMPAMRDTRYRHIST